MTIKYTLVSVLATSVDFVVFSFLAWLAFTYHSVCTGFGMAAGAWVSWTLNRNWVFAHSETNLRHQQSRYFSGVLLAAFLNVGLMALCADWLNWPHLPSRVGISVSVWALLFWFNSRVVFKI